MTDTAPPVAAVAPAGWFRGRLWFWAPLLPLVALDLWTKALLIGRHRRLFPGVPNAEEQIWGGWLSFSLVNWENTGTVAGTLRDFTSLLIVLRFLALGLLVWFALRAPRGARWQMLVLGMILAGAVGNLYDNLTQPNGGVRDFLLFRFGGWGFPAFNVADACITVGAIGLFLVLWRQDRKSPQPKVS